MNVGPNGDKNKDGIPIWWCDGKACKKGGTYTSCAADMPRRGYILKLTKTGEESLKD